MALIQDIIFQMARRAPHAVALRYLDTSLEYGTLAGQVGDAALAWAGLGLEPGGRLAVYLEKRTETVVALFGAAAAGGVFVPVNPLLKPAQVAHIVADCEARILVTSRARFEQLAAALAACAALRYVVILDGDPQAAPVPLPGGVRQLSWDAAMRQGAAVPHPLHRRIDQDLAAILYTSGSTGKPKGVMLSHRNLVAGALSVSGYLDNQADDRLLCVLPLSFDYGLSQLTTAFASGACAVLINHLLLRDIIDTVRRERITGLAAVPPLWIQLAQLDWGPVGCLRYITNSGGVMPRHALDALRRALPHTRIYLMYGLTEAFRSTCLAPEQLALRPDSIGKAIPNAEVLVLRADGTRCAANEPGELVHRGSLVALGYWNDPARTAERFRPLPPAPDAAGLTLPELAVWSGDTVRLDEQGYLYFVGRGDDMIKTSGYRVSPGEIEEIIYATGLVAEAAALGVPHRQLGQAIALLVTAPENQHHAAQTCAGAAESPVPAGATDAVPLETRLLAACKAALPSYMVPAWIDVRATALPRNPNGKIDRALLAAELAQLFHEVRA